MSGKNKEQKTKSIEFTVTVFLTPETLPFFPSSSFKIIRFAMLLHFISHFHLGDLIDSASAR